METTAGAPSNPGEKPRFAADRMLGKLAKWLRILGFDTVYSNAWAEGELQEKARSEERVILTRDTCLFRNLSGSIPAIFIESDSFWHQIREVVARLQLRPARKDIFTRCSLCNALLEELSREEAGPRVPEYVWKVQEDFARCPGCGRIYWSGTHRSMAENMLREIIRPPEEEGNANG